MILLLEPLPREAWTTAATARAAAEAVAWAAESAVELGPVAVTAGCFRLARVLSKLGSTLEATEADGTRERGGFRRERGLLWLESGAGLKRFKIGDPGWDARLAPFI